MAGNALQALWAEPHPLCDAVGGLRQTAAGAFAASDAAGLVGPHGDLDAVSGAELSHEAGEVGFDGAWGDVELAGDLIVGAALACVPQLGERLVRGLWC